MAQLNNRDENFISTLISVSGRVRPSDLHAVGAAQAGELLRAYQADHPEMPLGFEGDVLVYGVAAAPAPAPQPAPVPQPAPEQFAPVPQPAPEQFAPAPQPVAVEPLGAADFSPAPQPPTPSDGSEALPSWVYESPEATSGTDLSQIPAPAAAPELPMAGDFEPLPEYEGETPSGESAPKMAWWWWVVTALLFPLGGLIGYLVVNKTDPKGARNLLLLTVALILVAVLGVVAYIYLLGGALPF